MSYNSGKNCARDFKSPSRFALVWFLNYLHDFSLNCTPLGQITITGTNRDLLCKVSTVDWNDCHPSWLPYACTCFIQEILPTPKHLWASNEERVSAGSRLQDPLHATNSTEIYKSGQKFKKNMINQTGLFDKKGSVCIIYQFCWIYLKYFKMFSYSKYKPKRSMKNTNFLRYIGENRKQAKK